MKKYSYEDKLLEDILNDLDITDDDENLKAKIADIMHRGIIRLEEKYSNTIDFDVEMEARELLFAYCRYGRSNAIEEWETDFKCDIINLAIKGAIKAEKEAPKNEET